MDIKVWKQEEEKNLEIFISWWMTKNLEEPENFPLNMEPGEWDEQFRLYQSGGDLPEGSSDL